MIKMNLKLLIMVVTNKTKIEIKVIIEYQLINSKIIYKRGIKYNKI